MDNQLQNLVDVLNEQGEKIGEIKTALEVHIKGLWHATAHVWIYTSRGEVLLQKRSEEAVTYPGLWDISAAGHVDSGETPEEAAVREVEEEIGIKIKEEQLKQIFIEKIDVITPIKNWPNREFQYVYLLCLDVDFNKLKLQGDEVGKVKLMLLKNFKEAIINPKEYKKYVQHQKGNYYFKVIRGIKKEIRDYNKF